MITQVLESSAVWGVLLTLAAFGLGVLINKRTGKAILNPLLLGTAFVIVVLSVLNIPYAGSDHPLGCLRLFSVSGETKRSGTDSSGADGRLESGSRELESSL